MIGQTCCQSHFQTPGSNSAKLLWVFHCESGSQLWYKCNYCSVIETATKKLLKEQLDCVCVCVCLPIQCFMTPLAFSFLEQCVNLYLVTGNPHTHIHACTAFCSHPSCIRHHGKLALIFFLSLPSLNFSLSLFVCEIMIRWLWYFQDSHILHIAGYICIWLSP